MHTSHIIDLVFAALACVWSFFTYKLGRSVEREHTDNRIAAAEDAIEARGRLCTDPVHMTQGIELERERAHAARLAEELAVSRRVIARIVGAKAEIDEALEQRGLTLVRSPRTGGKWCIVPKRAHAECVPSVGTFTCLRCNVRIRAKSGQRSHVCADCREAPRVTFQVKGPLRPGLHVIRAEYAETLSSGDVRVTFVPFRTPGVEVVS